MREDWERVTPLVELGLDAVTALIQPVFPGQRAYACVPVAGGLANTNLRVTLADQAQPVLLRLYTRSPDEAAKEPALSQRVASHAPVARFFHFATDNPVTGHPYAVLEWIDGERLEQVAPTASVMELGELGAAVGAALAGIHAITFSETGFFDAALTIAQPISVGSDGLIGFLRQCLLDGRAGARLGADLTRELVGFVEREAGLLDTWDGPPCLSHSDFGGSNILVRRSAKGWQVAAVLDWEFAFSGSPFFDFGNLLRPPLGTRPGFEQAVRDGYVAAGGALPARWRAMSRLADLLSWADLLNRPQINPALLRDAHASMTATMADLDAPAPA